MSVSQSVVCQSVSSRAVGWMNAVMYAKVIPLDTVVGKMQHVTACQFVVVALL